MKRAFLAALLSMAAAAPSRAQEMNVVRMDGRVDRFSLAEIDSITFDVRDSTAASGLFDCLRIHAPGDISGFLVNGIDSMCFADNEMMSVYRVTGETSRLALTGIDSMTFVESSARVVTIAYSDTIAAVDNPLESAGVAVASAGADVTVTSTAGLGDITYALSGTTSDGVFKIYSDGDFALMLNGVRIANADGPAINIQAGGEIRVELADGTTNDLTDGVAYASPPGGEDQKAAFFSEGQLLFTGSGGLVIHGNGTGQNGLGSDDYIVVESGRIVILSAVKDGIHTNDGYFQHGGSVRVISASDGIDAGDGPIEISGGALNVLNRAADKDALKCDGTILISGGTVDLTVEGDQSKGLSAGDIRLTGGMAAIQTSGNVVLEPSGSGYDPSYCTAIKADNEVLLDGCRLSIATGGMASRGISSDGGIIMRSGSLSIASDGGGRPYINENGEPDAVRGACLNANGDIVLTDGAAILSHVGPGGRGISGDGDLKIGAATSGPTLEITTAGTPIPFGDGEAAEAKAVSVDSLIAIDNGVITISSADDAIKSKYRIEVNGGLIDIVDSWEGLESPNLFLNGGEIHATSTDDALNATYGAAGELDDGSILTVNGGYVHLNATAGDGIDSNGNLTINGGTIIVHGPPSQPDIGVDVNGSFIVNGGFLVSSQINSTMVEAPDGSSARHTVLLRSDESLAGGTLFHVEDTSGSTLLTFQPAHDYSAVLLSTASLAIEATYRVYTGGTCTGVQKDGIYTGGTYSGGTLRTTFTFGGPVQTVRF